jgi:hypothetical protein
MVWIYVIYPLIGLSLAFGSSFAFARALRRRQFLGIRWWLWAIVGTAAPFLALYWTMKLRARATIDIGDFLVLWIGIWVGSQLLVFGPPAILGVWKRKTWTLPE